MARLMAGTGVATITPPVGYRMHCLGLRREPSIGIHDDLKAKALVLDGEGGPLAIVALDTVEIPAAVAADVRARVRELTGLAGNRVMLACSHNHTTPGFPESLGEVARDQGYDRYRDLFVDLVAGAVAQAWQHRQPASLGAAEGRLPGWTTNRRHPERPVDDTVRVVRVDGEAGEPLACLVNFGCHGVAVGGQYRLWTADFPGYLAQVIEKLYPRALCLFLQGAHGDVLPFDWYFGKLDSHFRATYANARRIGYALGGEALRVMQAIEPTPEVSLGAVSRTIPLPRRAVPWTAEEAARLVEETVAANPGWEAERWTDEVDHANSAALAPGFYRISATRAQQALAAAGPRPGNAEAELQVFRLGDAVLAANPGELFDELGSRIRQESPVSPTFVISCANGSIGYIPARRDYDDLTGIPLRDLVDGVRYRYLYGVATSRLAPGAGEALVAATGGLISELLG